MNDSDTRLGNVPSGAAAAVGVAQPRRMPYRRRPPGGATRFLGFISAWLMLAGAAWATEFSCSLSLSDSPDPVPRGDTVSFVVTTNGPNITPPAEGEWVDGLNTVYEWNLDGEATWHPGTPPPVNTTPLEPGPHVMACRCTATYRFGWVDEDENAQYSGWTTQNVPAASTVFTVVQVVLISAGGVTSTKATPGDAETLVVGMGAAGETIAISAAANLDVWPAGYPIWGGDKIPDGSNGSASINWPIDTDGIYTVSAACGAGYSVALKIYVLKIVEIMVRPANQPSATYTGSTTIAAGAKEDAVHQADVRLKIAPVPPPTVPFSVGQPVKLVNYNGFNGANNASLDVLTPNPEGSVSFTSQYRYGKLTSSNVMHGAASGLAPCQIESVRSSASAAVTFAPSNYDADDRWASSVEYILPDGTSDETVTMKLDGAPLVGHGMHFFVEKVELWDCLADPPAPVTIENTAAAPDPFITTFADFTTNQAATGSDGKATGVLWTEDVSIYGYEWVSVTLRAYDYDALSSEGASSSSSSSMAAMAASAGVVDRLVAWVTSMVGDEPKLIPVPDLEFDGLSDTAEDTPGGFLGLGGNPKNLAVSLRHIPPASNLILTWTHPEQVQVKQDGSVKSSPQSWTWPTGSSTDFAVTFSVKGIAASGTSGDVLFTLRYNGNPDIQDTTRVTVCAVTLTASKGHGIWWFNGADASNYDEVGTLTVNPVTTGTFKWDVTAGETKIDLNNGAGDADSITAFNDNDVMIKSTGASMSEGDVTITLNLNGEDLCEYGLTVLTPKEEVEDSVLDFSYAEPPHENGYKSLCSFQIFDQLGNTLPVDIELNEKWTESLQNDHVPSTNWNQAIPSTGDWMVYPGGAYDGLKVCAFGTAIPNTTNPLSPPGPVKVCHWNGEHYAGSFTSGCGVKILVKKWQYYQDHARRE